ncbi:tudor domain-containing protein 6 [Biomphalaria glabrata]|nr:tudor domain-containing protein 6 [Biomphalaria glabrata]
MNRDRRQLNQLLGTIQMKQAVLDNQKKNVYELLDELVEEITKKIENLVPRDGEHAADLDKARVLIQQLDKASDLFTKIVLDTDSYLCQLAEEPLKTENKKEEKVQQTNPCQLVTAVAMSSEKRATLQSPVDQKFLLSSEKRASLQSPVDQKFLLSSENRATLKSPVDQKFLLSSENRATLQSPVDGTFLLERNFFKPIKERTIKHSSTDKLNQQSSLDKIVLPSTVDKTISKPFQERASLNIPDRKLLKPAIDKTFVKPAIEKTTPQAYSDKPVLHSPVERKLLQLTVDRTAVNTELNTKLFSPLFVNTNCLESSREELSDNLVIIKETILGVDEILNVVVIDVEHPWSFHVQLINDLNVVIAKKIREHIISGKMTILEAHQGLYCLAKFEDNCYYRAKIKSVQGEMVSVKYVDYGNSHLVSVNDIFVLPPSLASYPANSIWCALEGVCPKNVERMWPEVAIQQFQQCICDQHVKIQRLSEKKEKWYDSLPWIIKVVFNKKHLDHIASKSTDTKAESLSKFLINIGLAQAIELHDLVQELKVFYSDDAGADCPDLQEHTEANICSLTPHSHKVDKKAENLMQRESNYELGLLVHEKLVQLCRTMKLPSNVHSGAVSRDDEEMTLPILLRSVISPDSFFVSYVGSHLQEMVKEIQTQLDVSYNHQPKSELLARKQSFSPPSVGSLCCAIFSEDSLFYRGLILAASNKTSQHGKSVIQFLVFFIDFGDFEWVPESNVFPLSDKLQKIKSAVLWCSLSNLQPPDPHKPWSSHVVDIFKAMMSSERTSHLVVSKSKLCALQE